MKKVVIILCSILLFGFNNPNNNDIPIIIHFEQILNEYRHSNGLSNVVIDKSIKEFADKRSISLVQDFSHNGFSENLDPLKFSCRVAGENIAMIRNFQNNQKNYNSTNYDMAMYCFLEWKNSIPHNQILLNDKIKRFYLSHNVDKSSNYFCFIAMD
jgi:uncharacterized protein YkwD